MMNTKNDGRAQVLKHLSAALCCLMAVGCAEPDSVIKTSNIELASPIKVEIIATGAQIAGANGMALGPDGMLYVASVLGSNITVLDPDSGDVQRVYGASEGVIGPDDVAFSSDGAWYWTSIMTGEVAGFNVAGDKVIAANLTAGVNPITFSDDDRLFVAQCFFGVNLYEVDPAGAKPARLISDTLGPDCGLNGMDWGPDGRLYGPRWFQNEVVSFDVDAGSMRTEATGFNTPAAVKFDSEGRLHVLDTGTGELFRMQGEDAVLVAQLSPGLDNFEIDQEGRFFVSSFVDGFVKRVNVDGTITELMPGGMAHAGGITFHDGFMVVADLHSIRAFALDGQEAYTTRNVLGTGIMGGALNIASDDGQLILTSWVDGDVRLWDQAAQRQTWRKAGLAGPVAAVRFGAEVVVSEHGTGRVIGFDANGAEATVYAEGLPAPTGLWSSGGDLFVSDRKLGQILQLAEAGAVLSPSRVVVSGLTTPEGFVVKGQDFVVVEADLGQVTRIKAKGERLVLADVPAGSQAASLDQPPSQVFNGIAMDDAGALYVPGESNRVLYKITGAF
jgi:sugar lactone lactonase YvrE